MEESRKPAGRTSVVIEYSRLSSEYDTRWSFYITATVRETLTRLSLSSAARVLDVGCGTGALLTALRAQYPEAMLTGIDPAPGMLETARRKLPPDVELAEGWAEALPFADQTFDAIVSLSMFHYIRKPGSALEEMRRVLRPGGRLVITDWCADYLTCRVLDRYLRLFNAAHCRTYHRHELLDLATAAGFEGIECESYRINWFWGLMTLTGVRAA